MIWYNPIVILLSPLPLYYCFIAPPPFLSPGITTALFSISVKLLLFCFIPSLLYSSDSKYKRDHTILVFIWLISLSIMPSTSSLSLQMAKFISFSRLHNIPLYIYTHLLYPFICRWTLSCFYVLAIVNSAALNIGVCVFFLISVFIFLDIYLGVGFLGHIGSSIFSFFWETSILFSTMAAPIYIPTNNVWGFPFLHIPSRIYCLWIVWWWPFCCDTSLWFWFTCRRSAVSMVTLPPKYFLHQEHVQVPLWPFGQSVGPLTTSLGLASSFVQWG